MYVDTHVHMWALDRGDYTWISPKDPVLARDYTPDDLYPHLARNGVDAVILVQAAATAAETAYMLSLARQHSRIAGVVGGIDLLGERFDEEYGRFERERQFVGIRMNGPALPDPDSAAGELLTGRLSRLERDNRTLDLLVSGEHLARAAGLLGLIPGLRAVVNHLGSPGVGEGAWEPWNGGVELLAALPNTAFKLSGLLTQAGGHRPEPLRRYVSRLAEAFGPTRLLFGSDWPVALLRGTYDETVSLFEQVLPASWTDEQRGSVRAANAKRCYGL